MFYANQIVLRLCGVKFENYKLQQIEYDKKKDFK